MRAIKLTFTPRPLVLALLGPMAFSGLQYSPLLLAQGAVLEEVIVTARKREEAIQDVPVSVTAFTGNQLRDAGIANLKDLGYQTPGLQVDQSSSAQIWIRGIGQRDDGSRVDSPVGVYLDGLYIPRKDGQLLDLIDIQSVQVLRGPQGTLFGKNTTGGALLVTTKPPEESLSGFIDARVGNFDRRDIRGSLSVPLIEDTLLSKITVGSIERDGYQQNITTGQEPGSEDRQSAALQLRWLPSSTVSVDSLVYYGDVDEVQPATNCRFLRNSSFNGEDSLFGNRVGIGETSPVDAFDDNDNPLTPGFIDQSRVYEDACDLSTAREKNYEVTSEIPINFKLENLLLGLTVEWELNESMSLKSITGYGDQEKSGNFGNPDNDATHLNIGSRYRPEGTSSKRDHWSQEFQFIGSAFEDKLDYTFGMFAMKENIDDGTDRSSGTNWGYVIDSASVMVIGSPNTETQTYELENTTFAAFFQGSYELTENLELTAGVRWTSEKREQSVQLELLDEAAYRAIAFDAIADVPGITPISSAGIVLYDDLDSVIAQDIYGIIQDAFPVDSLGQPLYPLISAQSLDPDLKNDIDETWDEFTPMASLAYHLPDSFLDDSFIDAGMFYFTYAEGFKSGTFEPIGLDGQAVIEPESVENYEFGWKVDLLDSRMRFNGAIFRTDYDDMQLRQVLLDSSGIPRVVFRNASKTQIEGLELEWTWMPIDGLLLIATGSFNDYEYVDFEDTQFSTSTLIAQTPLAVVDRSSEPFAEVPETTYSFAVQYTLDTRFGTFVPRLDYSYVDEIFMGLDAGAGQNQDQATFDDYGLWNARIGWVSPQANFEAALYGTNITDELYYFGAAAVADSTGNFMTTSAPPRMYGLELRYNLN
ncbi:MAG: iron complex outermembrane receptor protein [Bacteroidia bacterium]|jgi:iron complex outermembrane receptor protein